jgi:hypothetical protein
LAKELIEDPVTQTLPSEWSAEKQIIAKDAMAVLVRSYPGYLWGIEYQDEPDTGAIAALIIRIRDIPTDIVYVVHYKDIDRDRMLCVMRAGGTLLEAHGLSRTKGRQDEVNGLKRTPSGLLVPASAAIPENNPGFDKFKKREDENSVESAVRQYVDSLSRDERAKMKHDYMLSTGTSEIPAT